MKFLRIALVIVISLVMVVWSFTVVQADDGADNVTDNGSIGISVTVSPPPPVGIGVIPPPPAPAPPPGTTDVSHNVTADGVFTQEVVAESFDGAAYLTIPEGTKALTKENEPLAQITIVEAEELPSPPENVYAIGLVYDFGPDGATFEPPITLTISYDPSLIPEGVVKEDLIIAYYDDDAGRWIELDSVVDTEAKTVTALVSHFSKYGVFGYKKVVVPSVPQVPSAAFTVSDLTISPSEVYIGETVTISVTVANIGGESGSYEVTLKINGVVEATREITVNAGFGKEVTFTTTRDIAGAYLVDVDGLTGSFTVKEKPVIAEIPPVIPKPINWPLIGGIIAAVVVIGGLLAYFLWWRRRTASI